MQTWILNMLNHNDKIIWIGIINIIDIKSMLNSKIDLNVNEWVERIVFHVTHIFCNVGSDLLSQMITRFGRYDKCIIFLNTRYTLNRIEIYLCIQCWINLYTINSILIFSSKLTPLVIRQITNTQLLTFLTIHFKDLISLYRSRKRINSFF